MLQELDDMEPIEGLFVAAMYDSQTQSKLSEYLRNNKVPNPVAPTAMHTTIVHSRVLVEFEENHTVDVVVDTSNARIEVWPNAHKRNVLVLLIDHPYLRERFEQARKSGATSDYPQFNPHVTLSYDIGDWDASQLPIPTFDLRINCEYTEYLVYDFPITPLDERKK